MSSSSKNFVQFVGENKCVIGTPGGMVIVEGSSFTITHVDGESNLSKDFANDLTDEELVDIRNMKKYKIGDSVLVRGMGKWLRGVVKIEYPGLTVQCGKDWYGTSVNVGSSSDIRPNGDLVDPSPVPASSGKDFAKAFQDIGIQDPNSTEIRGPGFKSPQRPLSPKDISTQVKALMSYKMGQQVLVSDGAQVPTWQRGQVRSAFNGKIEVEMYRTGDSFGTPMGTCVAVRDPSKVCVWSAGHENEKF